LCAENHTRAALHLKTAVSAFSVFERKSLNSLEDKRMSEQDIGSGVAFLVMPVILVVLCVAIFQRRDKQPIKARRPWLFVTPAALFSVRYIVSSIKYIAPDATLCGPYFVFLHTLTWASLLALIVRMGFLNFAFLVGKRSLSTQSIRAKVLNRLSTIRAPSATSSDPRPILSSENSSGDTEKGLPTTDLTVDGVTLHVERSRLLELKRKLSDRYLMWIILGGSLVFFLIESIYFLAQPSVAVSLRNSPECVASSKLPIGFFAIVEVISIMTILEFLRRLRSIDDFFKLSTEFKMEVILVGPSVIGVLWGIIKATSTARLISDWMVSGAVFAYFIISMGYVLRLSFQPRFKLREGGNTSSRRGPEAAPNSAVAANLLEFKTLLANIAGVELFQQHLLKELSVENIMFWNAVNEFSYFAASCFQADYIQKSAQSLYDLYISENGTFQVNISSEQHANIQECLQSSGSNTDLAQLRQVFDAAQKEIFLLMARDSFQRFKHTDMYEQWKKKAEIDTTGNLTSLQLV
jgi:hypothetical protein